MLTSSTQLQNRLFHVVERRRIYAKREKMKMRFSSLNMQIYDVLVAVVVAWLLSSLILTYDMGLESVAINCKSLSKSFDCSSVISHETPNGHMYYSLCYLMLLAAGLILAKYVSQADRQSA